MRDSRSTKIFICYSRLVYYISRVEIKYHSSKTKPCNVISKNYNLTFFKYNDLQTTVFLKININYA